MASKPKATNPLNIILGQEPQPLGTSHGVQRVLEPDNRDELPAGRGEAKEDKPALLGAVYPNRGRYALGGYLRK